MMFPFLKTALTNLFKKPHTEAFPNFEAEGLGAYRGRIEFNPETCINCGKCISVCAPSAIHDEERPVEGGREITKFFDLTSCTFCATCVDFCDEGSIKMTTDYHMVAEDPKDLIVQGTYVLKDIEGHIVCDLDGCVYCGLCSKNCPQNVITVDRKEKLWEIDLEGCVKCGICIGKCPKKVLSFGGED
jgi:formate hydrogenlyase subunit 6/NADH:ubiquinone oxidoreductase subunit I